MSLSVTLTTGGTTYRLRAEKINQTVERNPIAIGLPSTGDATEPVLIDLGFFKSRISIEGIVQEAAESEGGQTVMTKTDLEDFVLDNADNTVTTSLDGDVYAIKFIGVSFDLVAAQNDRWTFRLQMYGGKRSGS